MKSTTAIINYNSFLNNYNAIKARLPAGCKIMPVIKADAYGHGAAKIARWVPDNTTVCVARVCEAVELRRAGLDVPILILQPVLRADDMEPMKDVAFVAGDIAHLEVLREISAKHQCSIDVHIKVDTGMNRIGFSIDNIEKCLEYFQNRQLKMRGICTHFARADETDDELSQKQFELFQKTVQMFPAPLLRHTANTAAALRHPHMACDGVRVGLGLYGYAPLDAGLRPILSWRAPVLQIQTLRAGEGCSYGWRFVAERDTRIATVGVGYADGFARELSCGRGEVVLHGVRARTLGSVCMDQIIIDVSHIPQAAIGDDVWL
ncbi:MAG: alanine racemase, partial [Clostridia bacterium]|nr:alanine racemase [Clostridia bacterium]